VRTAFVEACARSRTLSTAKSFSSSRPRSRASRTVSSMAAANSAALLCRNRRSVAPECLPPRATSRIAASVWSARATLVE
jgi:hypothetical protein